MIEVIIQGGFGNQLFQYAMGYALAKRLNRPLILNVGFFDYVVNHEYGTLRENNLQLLSLTNPNFKRGTRKFKYLVWFNRLRNYSLGRLINLDKTIWEDSVNCRKYQPYVIEKAVGQKNSTLFGFWQNPKYFKEYISDLKQQFIPNYQIAEEVCSLKREIETINNSVGVHIRRGDFVNLGWAENESFYSNAISKMRASHDQCKFFIFTDDKEWARERFGKVTDIVVVDLKTPTCDIDEFFLLSLCKNQIISESTFGWWAAFLNDNPDRVIIVPKGVKGDMFPSEWIRL